MATKKSDKCAHPGCNCTVPKGSKYCSPYCEGRKSGLLFGSTRVTFLFARTQEPAEGRRHKPSANQHHEHAHQPA